MAEGQVSLSSFKEQFVNQLTCSVCLDQYTNPKILPCHHSFCLTCIELIPVEIKDGNCYIRCPTCRVDHLLPQGRARNLTNAFHINTLLDLRKKLVPQKNVTTPKQKKVASTSEKLALTPKEKEIGTTTNPTQFTCPKHNDLLKAYCETCNYVICRDCTISTEHNKHTFYLISECYPKHHQQILDNLHPVKHKLADMDTAMTHLDTKESEVLLQGENIKEEINQHAQQLINDIQRSRTHLTQQVDTIVQQKTQTLATQRQQAQKIHTHLQTCQDTIEHNLKEWTQQQILAQKHTMIVEMNTATQHVDPTVFQPIENTNITFKTKEMTVEVGVITNKTFSKATLEASPCLAKQPSTATLTLQSQDGSPFPLPDPSLISSILSSPGNIHTVKCPITQTQPGKHNVMFTPLTRQDKLIVQVGGVDVPDSPYTLPVIPTPDMRGEPVNIISGLNQPRGIAVCDNGDIVVAELGTHCVTILNKDHGKKVKSFVREGTCPRGVAISIDGHILVTDEHRIQKLTITNGECVRSVGSGDKGNGKLQFNNPAGIAVHPTTGQIFVVDSENNRIQVFTNDLTFSHTIKPSKLLQRFNHPCDVAIDSEGYLYVADLGNRCITKMSNKGKSIQRLANATSPICLTIHHSLVYVCEVGNFRVSVYDANGKSIEQFGRQKLFSHPYGIAIDTSGNLYVSDFIEKRIVVF